MKRRSFLKTAAASTVLLSPIAMNSFGVKDSPIAKKDDVSDIAAAIIENTDYNLVIYSTDDDKILGGGDCYDISRYADEVEIENFIPTNDLREDIIDQALSRKKIKIQMKNPLKSTFTAEGFVKHVNYTTSPNHPGLNYYLEIALSGPITKH